MEKLIVTLRNSSSDDGWVQTLCGPVADELLGFGLPGVTINVRDAPVRAMLMTLITLDPPVQAVVSLWTDQHYGSAVRAALDVLRPHADMVAAYLVTESVPLRPPAVAIGTQSTFGYVQNYVVRALTPDAPAVSAIVEELFPIEAVSSLHAFFGAADDADLADRIGRMVASTSAFGYTYRDTPVAAIILRRRHIAWYPFSGSVLPELADELSGYSQSPGTLRFTAATPLPDDVVRQLLDVRMRQIDSRP